MFDGSHRTNKREINLAGASASSKSSRRTNLDVARKERQKRAVTKLRRDSVSILQRTWRGRRSRVIVASDLDSRYADSMAALLDDDDDYNGGIVTIEKEQEEEEEDGRGTRRRRRRRSGPRLADASSLLAFRLSPALLPFFAYRRDPPTAACATPRGVGWGAVDDVAARCGPGDVEAEARLRRDLNSLGDAMMRRRRRDRAEEDDDDDDDDRISSIATRRIVSIVLVLLRQSMSMGARGGTEDDIRRRDGEDEGLVRLLDILLDASSSSSSSPSSDGMAIAGIASLMRGAEGDRSLFSERPSDYYMSCLSGGRVERSRMSSSSSSSPTIAAWTIDLFLCLRDVASSSRDVGPASPRETISPMDVDGVVANGDRAEEGGGARGRMSSTLLKWCCRIVGHLATLDGGDSRHSTTTMTTECPALHQQGLALLASILCATLCQIERGDSWMHEHLIPCLSNLEQRLAGPTSRGRMVIDDVQIFSLLIHYLSTAMNSLSATASPNRIKHEGRRVPGFLPSFLAHYSSSTSSPLMDAVRDTLSTRELVVLNKVLLHANACQQQPRQSQEVLIYAIPIILQYTLRHQQDLTILASFAARGENVASWFLETNHSGSKTTLSPIASVAAAEAYKGEDIDEESDDDEGDKPAQQQSQRPAARESLAASTARYSRADLQTLPRLDALYQTSALRAKQATVDRLRSVIRSHGSQVELLITLAEKIGRGEWIQQLGNALFSHTQSQPPSSLLTLLSPLSWPHWQKQAQSAYTSALATVMAFCSGIKAGRNAASPLLAKLAFSETFLDGMWERSIWNMDLLASQSKTEDSSAIASACEVCSSFCDSFSHQLLAVNDDDFLRRYHPLESSRASDYKGCAIVARDVVRVLRVIMNDLYWIRPVLASDITSSQNFPDSNLRFQRARLFLSGTKLWNSLYERWCRLYRVVKFCEEDCWWFPHLVSRGQHENNPIIQSQVTTFGDQMNDGMDDSSLGTAHMDDEMVEAASISQHDAGGDALANTFRDPKMARVLTYIPQAMPFSRRVNLFNSLLESDKLRSQDETMSLRQMMMNFEEEEATEISGRERVTIRRDLLYSDSKHLLNQLGKRLRKKVQVTFVNKHGQQEAGIDGGGVFKEFLDDLIRDAFLPETVREESVEGENNGSVSETHPDFFSVTPLQTLTVNTALDGNDLSHYEFLGRVLGKAIYESILVEPQFCLPFLNKLLGKQNSLDDLKNLDPEYYKNLMSIRHLSAEETRELGLTFELHDSNTATIELMPGGCTIPVTKENVIQYIHLAAHQKMNVRGSRQTAAFLHGFRDIIPSQWVRLFSAYELQKLISGDDAVKGIDVRGMMAVMRYSGGLHPSQPIVHWLWEVIDEMTPDQQRKFLKFMTSCSRQPLLGFASMVPAPCIQQTRLREDDRGNDIAENFGGGNIRLPTSSTCMNLLKLPKYTSKEMLKEKLLYAIEAAAGFELS